MIVQRVRRWPAMLVVQVQFQFGAEIFSIINRVPHCLTPFHLLDMTEIANHPSIHPFDHLARKDERITRQDVNDLIFTSSPFHRTKQYTVQQYQG